MAGALDSVFQPLAQQLLRRYGEAMTLTKRGAETYDPATGAITFATGTSISLYGYVDVSATMQRDGSVVAGSQSVLLAKKDVTVAIEVGDTLTIKGVDWSVADDLDRQGAQRDVAAAVQDLDAIFVVRVRR